MGGEGDHGHSSSCDTELCLSPGARQLRQADTATQRRIERWLGEIPEEEHQQITMFYAGRMFTCDVTEIQARAIIWMARVEMEERTIAQRSCDVHLASDSQFTLSRRSRVPPPPPSSATTVPQLITAGLSMKRSLRQFLQKRKARNLHAASPYNHPPN